jgi:hypothetical protein
MKVLWTKDKITKQNIESVVDRFKDGLVMLKPEGMKVQMLQDDSGEKAGENSRVNNNVTNSRYNTKEP